MRSLTETRSGGMDNTKLNEINKYSKTSL